MLEPPEGTKPQTPEEILAGIHAGLQSKDIQTCLNAIQQLGEQKFSSPAILRTMEGLALKDESEAVREAARQALTSPTHRYIQGRTSNLDRKARQTILAEITSWEVQGLISSDQADVIRHRYDFDLTPAPVKEDPPDLPMPTLPASVKSEQGEFRSAPPRPGLTQTLLSETSIKIALYLGAFFVIAAAVILATVLEAARLPILLAATALFAGGAILTRSKLPTTKFCPFHSFFLPAPYRRQCSG